MWCSLKCGMSGALPNVYEAALAMDKVPLIECFQIFSIIHGT